ncbi:universal stress protein [Kribbella sp. VKM Ac-2568]|uniref:universal stress protein n=1 Tax=Kribbella sp. VKM Ac-2568 TaxID=2512219 RepID=UPI0010497473|nr:universal stress protein [Kribbella sp. VKM Ac-2568]TCM50567.1 nucleotide-binding universal stress UspA family protein [Kribbella sp. VKM Ac-2568]
MSREPVIHVGVDGSWRDTGALEWALQESLFRRVPLRAVHVIEEKLRHSPYWQPTVIDDAATDLVQEVQQKMKSQDDLLDHGADLVVGPPATTLTELAAKGELLVVGRRGMGKFKRLLIGSTSEAAAIQATVPVVVVPEGWKSGDHCGPVVVALDDSGEPGAAIEFALTAATERHAPVRMVHVWDLPSIYSWDAMNVAGVSDEWNQTARRHCDTIADQWRQKYPEIEIEVEVRRGHPVDGIVAAAESADAQLVVVGHRRRRHFATALLGSVARGVLQHATCPVTVVPVSTDDA